MTTRDFINLEKRTAVIPFDADDEGKSEPPATLYHQAARMILGDLSDRRGVGNELGDCDHDVRKEIVQKVAAIIEWVTTQR